MRCLLGVHRHQLAAPTLRIPPRVGWCAPTRTWSSIAFVEGPAAQVAGKVSEHQSAVQQEGG